MNAKIYDEIDKVIEMYQNGKSLTYIGNLYDTYNQKIKQILNENGIQTRTKAQQNFITNQERSMYVDQSYFDNIDNTKKSWILGFLAADGSVSKDRNAIKISLSSVDREILEKIKEEIQIERKIKDSETNKGFFVSSLVWSCGNHKRQLQKYGIVPNKTYKKMFLPSNLSVENKKAFILGYFDGDGCFKNDGTTCRFEICSYRPELLQDFSDFILKEYKFESTVYKDKSRENYYTLTLSTKKAVLILEDLYSICPLFLKRKKEKFLKWKKQNNL